MANKNEAPKGPCGADFDTNLDGDLELVDASETDADFSAEETNRKGASA
ncbi:hypothetical protein SEA_LIBERTYBELL_3 [Streptomyces phage LibertyBell]|nr:hypothetical protein SEA_LIBERTYBELL_3 [Streptomyces phage LibertyBell]